MAKLGLTPREIAERDFLKGAVAIPEDATVTGRTAADYAKDKPANEEKPKAKPYPVMTTVQLTAEHYKRIKLACIEGDTTMADVFNAALTQYFDNK